MNMGQTITDEMVKHGYITDDDYKNVIPYFAPVEFDKNHPGVIITVL